MKDVEYWTFLKINLDRAFVKKWMGYMKFLHLYSVEQIALQLSILKFYLEIQIQNIRCNDAT